MKTQNKTSLLRQLAEAVLLQVKRNRCRKYKADQEAHDGTMQVLHGEMRELLSRVKERKECIALLGGGVYAELHHFITHGYRDVKSIAVPADVVLKLVDYIEQHDGQSEKKAPDGGAGIPFQPQTSVRLKRKSDYLDDVVERINAQSLIDTAVWDLPAPIPQKPEQTVPSKLEYAAQHLYPHARTHENIPVCRVGCPARAPSITVDGTVVVTSLAYDSSLDKGVHRVRLWVKQTDDDAITKLIERTGARLGDEVRMHFCDQHLMIHALLNKDTLEFRDCYGLDVQYCEEMTCSNCSKKNVFRARYVRPGVYIGGIQKSDNALSKPDALDYAALIADLAEKGLTPTGRRVTHAGPPPDSGLLLDPTGKFLLVDGLAAAQKQFEETLQRLTQKDRSGELLLGSPVYKRQNELPNGDQDVVTSTPNSEVHQRPVLDTQPEMSRLGTQLQQLINTDVPVCCFSVHKKNYGHVYIKGMLHISAVWYPSSLLSQCALYLSVPSGHAAMFDALLASNVLQAGESFGIYFLDQPISLQVKVERCCGNIKYDIQVLGNLGKSTHTLMRDL